MFIICMVVTSKHIKKVQQNKCKSVANLSPFISARRLSSIDIGSFDSKINPVLSQEELRSGTRMGMDSHADTTCVNKHAYIESIVEGHTVGAIPFDQSIGKLTNLPIVNAIYAFDDPQSMRTTLLRFNQAIFIKNVENALLCPNQAREQGTTVDDVPAHLDLTGASTFTVIAGDLQLPLNQNGPTAYL